MSSAGATHLALREVRIRDFRAIRELTIQVADLTLLVGENNAGKTSILDAVGVALGNRGSIDDLRHQTDGTRADRFEIDVRLEPAGGTEFDDTLATWVGNAVQIPTDDDAPPFVALRVTGELNMQQGRVDDRRYFLQGWWEEGDQEGPSVIRRPIPREFREALLFQMLDARRDVADQLRTRSSFWGRLVGDLELAEPVAEELFAELGALGQRIVDESSVLSSVRSDIQRSVDTLAPTAGRVELAPLPTVTDSLARSMDVVVAAPDSAAISLGRQGAGARSLAVMMIFQAFAQRRLGGRDARPSLSVTAFEEPEAHLHPQAARAVEPLIAAVPGQKLVSSHSTHLASLVDLQNIRVVRRVRGNVCTHSLSVHAIEAIQQTPTVRRLVQQRQGEVLFARAVVIVEGETEQAMLEPFFESLCGGRTQDQLGITVVDAEGAQNVKPFVLLLESLGIPWVVLLDGDAEGASALDKTGDAIGRTLTPSSPEVVVLPCADIETYAIDPSWRKFLIAAIEQRFGSDALSDYESLMHGAKGKKGVIRDYLSEGGSERLLHDFLSERKPLWGQPFGVACCSGNSPATTPPAVCDVVTRAREMAGLEGAS